jgi:predicted transposase YdaD
MALVPGHLRPSRSVYAYCSAEIYVEIFKKGRERERERGRERERERGRERKRLKS